MLGSVTYPPVGAARPAPACAAPRPQWFRRVFNFRQRFIHSERLFRPEDQSYHFAEAIAQVLTDRSLAATLSKRGLERALMFTWEQTARKTLAVYHQMMEEST